jgi:hypothetical protein
VERYRQRGRRARPYPGWDANTDNTTVPGQVYRQLVRSCPDSIARANEVRRRPAGNWAASQPPRRLRRLLNPGPLGSSIRLWANDLATDCLGTDFDVMVAADREPPVPPRANALASSSNGISACEIQAPRKSTARNGATSDVAEMHEIQTPDVGETTWRGR